MSKVLVIPDTHLKPKMFDLADKIMKEHRVDYAVQLGDNVDDFYCYDDQYRNHNARMLQFKYDHPDTVWLWGNHELSYLLDRPVTGNIYCGKTYAKLYQENFEPKFIHLDGKVIFSHAGIFQEFLEDIELTEVKDVTVLVKKLNDLDLKKYWNDYSPIWARHFYDPVNTVKMFDDFVQVIGHTPIEDVSKDVFAISTDVFSTNWGKQLGVEQMIIIDTETGLFEQIEIDFRKEFGDERD